MMANVDVDAPIDHYHYHHLIFVVVVVVHYLITVLYLPVFYVFPNSNAMDTKGRTMTEQCQNNEQKNQGVYKSDH